MIIMAKGSDKWPDLVKNIMKLRVAENEENSLIRRGTASDLKKHTWLKGNVRLSQLICVLENIVL
jgi:hypothetical protein